MTAVWEFIGAITGLASSFLPMDEKTGGIVAVLGAMAGLGGVVLWLDRQP